MAIGIRAAAHGPQHFRGQRLAGGFVEEVPGRFVEVAEHHAGPAPAGLDHAAWQGTSPEWESAEPPVRWRAQAGGYVADIDFVPCGSSF